MIYFHGGVCFNGVMCHFDNKLDLNTLAFVLLKKRRTSEFCTEMTQSMAEELTATLEIFKEQPKLLPKDLSICDDLFIFN